ncbi:hypothetical protein H5410_000945 [Solanum commersonii]|uniref:Uncharacterized protein n=1 Tax=Solanum commersonii TaxID=4109 RepID=A0A9J6AXP5_SOLCO|nr:hypothetical protein H5410_000945 [Solanum commersonii]
MLWDLMTSSSGHGSTTLTTVLLDSKCARWEIIMYISFFTMNVETVSPNLRSKTTDQVIVRFYLNHLSHKNELDCARGVLLDED